VSVAVILEYEAVLKRNCREFGLSEADIDDAVDAICSQAGLHRQCFLWRPAATDSGDDLVLAQVDNVSADRLVAAIVNERVGDWTSIKARAKCGSLEKLRLVLSKVSVDPPEAADRL
jgi:hypothetical protein